MELRWVGSVISVAAASWLVGCTLPTPGDGSSDDGDESSEVSGDECGSCTASGFEDTGASASDPTHGSGHGSASATSTTTPGSDSTYSTTDPSATATDPGTTTSTTSTTGDTDGAAGCGLELDVDPGLGSEYICACDFCNVEFADLTPASGNAVLDQCECLCAEIGCGSSISGGATSGGETGDDSTVTDPGPGEDGGVEDDGAGEDDGSFETESDTYASATDPG